jgi:hypothetical protein
MSFRVNTSGYLNHEGVDVFAFSDTTPDAKQGGIVIAMHGRRVAACGDVRFHPAPGQWQPVPKQLQRETGDDFIKTTLAYPDESRHLKGFNPLIYPDAAFEYDVTARGVGEEIELIVSFHTPAPAGLYFNLELFPGDLFGQPWLMEQSHCEDGQAPQCGIFPPQPNGPIKAIHPREYDPMHADDIAHTPYAVGQKLVIRPDSPLFGITIEGESLHLLDGRVYHDNGWFTVSQPIPQGATANAVKWRITPSIITGWRRAPVIQSSQIGYHPKQTKCVTIELDARDETDYQAQLLNISDGKNETISGTLRDYGKFLRYRYLMFDFSHITAEGLYQISYGSTKSNIFRIAHDIYDRGVWQPTLEYFLPIQMCHMQVRQKHRIWHGKCHTDDARMSPVGINHFDGYVQGDETLTQYEPGAHIPGLNAGGWHDAGDFDLRIESQCNEIHALALTFEEFGVNYDTTTINQATGTVEIHKPDGKNDILQQIEHGLISVVGGYRALGRLYRGIICPTVRQYVVIGDAINETDCVQNADDRWVFTEDNPPRQLMAVAQIAAGARAMRGYNAVMAADALEIAAEIYDSTSTNEDTKPAFITARAAKIHAAVELYIATNSTQYLDFLLQNVDYIAENISRLGWLAARIPQLFAHEKITAALPALASEIHSTSRENPFGIPYTPRYWGHGWGALRQAFQYFFLHKACPRQFPDEILHNSLHFILGHRPGENTASLASGVGAKSVLAGYGANRADWGYIPGGVVSGTAIIAPDLPELLDFPFLWQQTEYVIGGGGAHYMFLVLAVQKALGRLKFDEVTE